MGALTRVRQLGGAPQTRVLAVGLTVDLAQAWIPNHLAGECSKSNIDSVVGKSDFFSRAPGKYIIRYIYLKTKDPNQLFSV